MPDFHQTDREEINFVTGVCVCSSVLLDVVVLSLLQLGKKITIILSISIISRLNINLNQININFKALQSSTIFYEFIIHISGGQYLLSYKLSINYENILQNYREKGYLMN